MCIRDRMQTGAQKVGGDVVCPHCSHRFQLIEPDRSAESPTRIDLTSVSNVETETMVHRPAEKVVPRSTNSFGTSRFPVSGNGSSGFRPVGFQCPYCQTTRAPTVRSEISQIGWLVFAILLITTCFGCVIGLFIRDNYRECSQCKIRLG